MKESNIIHENDKAWVAKDAKRKRYTVFRIGITHSTSDCSFHLTPDGLSLAMARCNYLGRNQK